MTMKAKTVQYCNILCAFLMLALVICQFLPFWSANGDAASLQEYTWWPERHTALTDWFKTNISSDFRVNDIVMPTLLMLIFGCLGSVMCLIKSKSCLPVLPALICGISGIWGYLAKPAYQLGSLWFVHLMLAIAIVLICIPLLISSAKTVISWFKE